MYDSAWWGTSVPYCGICRARFKVGAKLKGMELRRGEVATPLCC